MAMERKMLGLLVDSDLWLVTKMWSRKKLCPSPIYFLTIYVLKPNFRIELEFNFHA